MFELCYVTIFYGIFKFYFDTNLYLAIISTQILVNIYKLLQICVRSWHLSRCSAVLFQILVFVYEFWQFYLRSWCVFLNFGHYFFCRYLSMSLGSVTLDVGMRLEGWSFYPRSWYLSASFLLNIILSQKYSFNRRKLMTCKFPTHRNI